MISRFASVKCQWMLAASIAAGGLFPAAAHAALNPRDVDAAIDKAVENLLTSQSKDGSWEAGPRAGANAGHAWGGETAIVTYALLAAGKTPQDPQIKKAIEWLEMEDINGTYAVGLRAQVWNLMPERARTRAVVAGRDRDTEYVLFGRGLKAAGKGFYGYSWGQVGGIDNAGKRKVAFPRTGSGGGDRSNSQYGVLGAWALEQAGAEIPTSFWLEEDEAWKKDQNADGGWSYSGRGGESTATMSAAGLATLFVTQDYVMRAQAHLFDTCKGGVTNQNIEKGLAWFDRHAIQALAGGGYGLYGIERVGVASGRKYFGTVDWYKVGAENIVKRQGKNGSWGAFHETCFNLLFLVRGRAPVMMNKLQYDVAAPKFPNCWNERPRDAANLAKWTGKQSLEGFLNWQIVNLRVDVDELHDAPILYIGGSEEMILSNQEIDKLRQFVEQGGMILGNADCNNKTFAQSFEKMGNKMFPKYEFRKLPASHPIFDEQYHATKWKTHPTVMGLSNGIRELILLLPDSDAGHAWQTESFKTKEVAFQLGGNIFLYATGKENLTHKGDTYIIHPIGKATKEVKLARLSVGGNWDPEPGGWRRLSAFLHNTRKVDVTPEPVKLGDGKLLTYKIAHLTGTTKFNFSADQQKELKDFIDKGGTLMIDAAGGSGEFADSAEAELKTLWGDDAAKGLASPIPAENLLFSTPTVEVSKVNYRTFARRQLSGHVHEPRIRGISVGGKKIYNVFYSREDLSAGIVGEPVDGIVGYSPSDATQLVANMIMYADQGGIVIIPPPATQPTTKPTSKPTTGATSRPTSKAVGTPAPAAPTPPLPTPPGVPNAPKLPPPNQGGAPGIQPPPPPAK